MNTGIGKILSKDKGPIGHHLRDPFFDSYREEILTCCDILDRVGLSTGQKITVTFDKAFLRKIVHSHFTVIRNLEKAD